MLCEQIPEVEVVKAFNDPQKFLTSAGDLDFDACILDIEMPKMNGLQVAQALQNKLIIFATAYKQYAADAFDLDAIDFVGKPVTRERLETAIKKALSRMKLITQERRLLHFNTDKGKALIDISKIALISTSAIDSRDKVLTMMDQSSVVLKNVSFETLQSRLPALEFSRINKKQIIALEIVASFTFNEILTKVFGDAPIKLSLSETYRQEFQNAIRRFS
jgi:DNA-binding LytR/AlgR family response regulator